jgi:plasmid stabilization system protein ParE
VVAWSRQAKRDLRAIFDHIAIDSTSQTKTVTEKIGAKVTVLEKLPRIGKMAPELGDPNVRELPIYTYRILYEIQTDNVEVLAIIHKRKNTKPEDIDR